VGADGSGYKHFNAIHPGEQLCQDMGSTTRLNYAMTDISTTTPMQRARAPKFADPLLTADGEIRASVALARLRTLWFNTGSLCNLACNHCYVGSSPTNDQLAYLTKDDVAMILAQLDDNGDETTELGYTGGEPFMNPDFITILGDGLARGYHVLVLTNAMRPMMKCDEGLLKLQRQFGSKLTIRVSLDHYRPALHDRERGRHAWRRTLPGLDWLCTNGFRVHIAGRTCWDEEEVSLRNGFAALFEARGYMIDAWSPVELVLFPEMDKGLDVPEITSACWKLLGVDPNAMMCASSRMVLKRKGAAHATFVPCTLLPNDPVFDMGEWVDEARRPVELNHPYCARFCVLGGGSCSDRRAD
jgi:uncharacterized Fe-S cluster-containing radical SAM superfamily protein